MTQMQTQAWGVGRVDELDSAGPGWIPVRKQFGVRAFGVNAWRPREDGTIISEHDEVPSGHEELYVVLSGSAAFTLGDDEVDAPAGTIVFVRDPGVKRSAVSKEDGTVVLAVGAKPGEAFEPRPWEVNAEIFPLFGQGEYAEAKRRLEQALEEYPDAEGLLYNLACAEARLGETEAALDHLTAAIAAVDAYLEYAQTDPDFESIRDDPRFPKA